MFGKFLLKFILTIFCCAIKSGFGSLIFGNSENTIQNLKKKQRLKNKHDTKRYVVIMKCN